MSCEFTGTPYKLSLLGAYAIHELYSSPTTLIQGLYVNFKLEKLIPPLPTFWITSFTTPTNGLLPIFLSPVTLVTLAIHQPSRPSTICMALSFLGLGRNPFFRCRTIDCAILCGYASPICFNNAPKCPRTSPYRAIFFAVNLLSNGFSNAFLYCQAN